jgi:sulfonate transport system substrate-binding protein
MNRRSFLFFSAALNLSARRLAFADTLKELRVGYQKTGVLLVVKARKQLEKRFASRGLAVRWVEFPSGPPLLEALNADGVDYGYTGDTPPIFAQAARANIRYVGVIPARGYGQAIVVLDASPMKTLSDLKGKKVGVAKGSSAHNLLVTALESADIAWSDITPVYLAPADAASAFARGSIDAWSIWDPFYAIAELRQKARALPIDPKKTAQNSFFLANRDFLALHADVISAVNEASGVEIAAQRRSVDRAEFTFAAIDDKVIAEQQSVADRFERLGLIPAHVNVRDIVWNGKSSS